MHMSKKGKDDVTDVLNEIEITLKRQNSFGYIFLHGIVRGMGTALGATVLVALLTSITLNFFGSPQMDAVIEAVVSSMLE